MQNLVTEELKLKEVDQEFEKIFDPNIEEFYTSITVNNKILDITEAYTIPKETITMLTIDPIRQISNIPITDLCFQAIAKFLTGLINIENLDINVYEATLTDQALNLLSEPLSEFTKLKEFTFYQGGNLAKSAFTDIGFGDICMALANATNLQSFFFECTGLKNNHSLTDTSFQLLAYSITQFAESLKVLRIYMPSECNRFQVTDEGLLNLGKALINTTNLTSFDFKLEGDTSENIITDTGFMSIIDGLSKNTGLKKLGIFLGGENCTISITDKSFIHLSEKFSELFNLISLGFDFNSQKGQNQITDLGFISYSNLLKHNKSLLDITLKFGGKNSKNKITDEGIIELCSAIDEAKIKLHRSTLQFGGNNCENHITDKGFEQFAKIIHKVDSFASGFIFYFQGNNCKHQITEKSARVVQKALEDAKFGEINVKAFFNFGGLNTNNNEDEIKKVLKQIITEFGKQF